jgi:hypothetical protein
MGFSPAMVASLTRGPIRCLHWRRLRPAVIDQPSRLP